MKSWRFFVPLLAVAALGMLLATGLREGHDPRYVPSPLVGKPAPDFVLHDLIEGRPDVSKQSLLGKPYLLNVWGSWCVACQEMAKDTFADPRVMTKAGNFVAVKIDATDQDDPSVEAISKKYDVKGLPTVLLIGSDGKERKRFTEFVGPGWNGQFGVFPGHQSMVVALRPGVVRYTLADRSTHHIAVGGGFAVVEAPDGIVALDEIDQEAPDAVVLDLNLPRLDGYAVLSRLRSRPTTAALPVIVLTAKGDEENEVRVFELGANDFLTKPIDAGRLRNTLARTLRARDELA